MQKLKPKAKLMNTTVRTVHVCAYRCTKLSCTTQHRTVLIIFTLNPQTKIIALMLSQSGGALSILWLSRKVDANTAVFVTATTVM